MTTNTPPPTDLKDLPEVHRIGSPDHPLPPHGDGKPGKPRKRGFLWGLFLLIIAGVTGYAVWRAGQPGVFQQPGQNQGNGRGKKGGRGGGFGGGLGPVPVVTAKVSRGDIPVYDAGL